MGPSWQAASDARERHAQPKELTAVFDLVALGAFLASALLSESQLSEGAASDILPLTDIFTGSLRVVGMLLDSEIPRASYVPELICVALRRRPSIPGRSARGTPRNFGRWLSHRLGQWSWGRWNRPRTPRRCQRFRRGYIQSMRTCKRIGRTDRCTWKGSDMWLRPKAKGRRSQPEMVWRFRSGGLG